MPRHRWDLVISDNRYGFTHPGVPSAILTHQLGVISGLGKEADGLLRRFLYGYIDRFSQCWVPDLPGESNLAGVLSHPGRLPKAPTRYLGLLSRFDPHPDPIPTDLLILLSGPEPQRSLLEAMIIAQLGEGSGKVTLVRGLPSGGAGLALPRNVEMHHHLPAFELARRIAGARKIICRPGYSTLMDLLRLGKSAVLVPTPGQTEQEYLAYSLAPKGWFAQMLQDDRFSVNDAIRDFTPVNETLPFSHDFDHFKKVLDDFVI
jgi:hypothetical protein